MRLHEVINALISLANGSDEAWIIRQLAPKHHIGTEGRDRIGRLSHRMRHRRVHRLILVLVGDLTLVPTLEVSQEQGRQH